MLDFAGADAEGQRTESAVRGSVAIAADDGETGLRDAEFRADDVHDALIAAEHVEETHTVLLAIARQGFELQPRIVIHDREFAVCRYAALPGCAGAHPGRREEDKGGVVYGVNPFPPFPRWANVCRPSGLLESEGRMVGIVVLLILLAPDAPCL